AAVWGKARVDSSPCPSPQPHRATSSRRTMTNKAHAEQDGSHRLQDSQPTHEQQHAWRASACTQCPCSPHLCQGYRWSKGEITRSLPALDVCLSAPELRSEWYASP